MVVDLLADETIALVGRWLDEAHAHETDSDRQLTGPLRQLIEDPDGVEFTMRFVDRVARPDDHHAAAHQLAALVRNNRLPDFLTGVDRLLLRLGGRLATLAPRIVIARRTRGRPEAG